MRKEKTAGLVPDGPDRILVASRDDELAAGSDDEGTGVDGHLDASLNHIKHLEDTEMVMKRKKEIYQNMFGRVARRFD